MKKQVVFEKGYLHDRVPTKVYKELLDSINISDINSKEPLNSVLAGNIEKEFDVTKLIPDSFYDYVSSLANGYYDNFRSEKIKNNKRFVFYESWVNYQKKYEFNPLHNHAGSLSYVVWIKIPYNLEDELSMPNNVKSRSPVNSVFEFVVNDTPHPIGVNSSMEGDIIIFNSNMKHQVHPFYTSDEYRISMSGNLFTEWLD